MRNTLSINISYESIEPKAINKHSLSSFLASNHNQHDSGGPPARTNSLPARRKTTEYLEVYAVRQQVADCQHKYTDADTKHELSNEHAGWKSDC